MRFVGLNLFIINSDAIENEAFIMVQIQDQTILPSVAESIPLFFAKLQFHERSTQLKCEKVQVGKDQEKPQSEKDPHSKKKTRWETAELTIKYLYYGNMSSYFPNRLPLSYLNLTTNMKTYIRH